MSDFPFSSSFNPPRATGSPLGQSAQTFQYAELVEKTFEERGYESFAQWPGFRLPVSAQVEPDADADGFGDVTQDLCPGEYGSVQGCPRADLSLAMTAPALSPGPDATFTLTVTNNGPDPVPDAAVTDPLPAGTTVQPSSTLGTTAARPILGSLRQSSAVWRETRLRESKLAVGDRFRFNLTPAGTVTLSFVRERGGRRVRGACVSQTRTNAGTARCTRRIRAGTLTVAGKTGANSLPFTGRLAGGRVLAPGTYAVTFIPSGRTVAGTGQKLMFTITG